LVDKIKDRVSQVVCADVTDERSMRTLNLSEVDVSVVALGDNIQTSILAVAMLRKLGAGRIIARATNSLHEHVLKEVGASEIIKVEEEMGALVASKITAHHVLNRYNFASGFSLVEVKVSKELAGKALVEAQLKQRYKINTVAIQKRVPEILEDGRPSFKIEINDNPMPMDIIYEDNILVVVGKDENIQRFLDRMEKN